MPYTRLIRRYREIQRLVGATTENWERMQALQSEDREELPTMARNNVEKSKGGFPATEVVFRREKKTERNSDEEREKPNA